MAIQQSIWELWEISKYHVLIEMSLHSHAIQWHLWRKEIPQQLSLIASVTELCQCTSWRRYFKLFIQKLNNSILLLRGII